MTDPTDATRTRDERPFEELVGRTFAGKYRALRLIGRGGMGGVYEAEHLGIGRRVALKVLDRALATDEAVVGRFAREARAASAVESEHIVQVLDAGTDEGLPFLVMELLRGEDLGSRLRREARVPIDEALHVIAQLLRGLSRAHAAGIVHRDLKPDNVLLVPHRGDPSFVKIVDFGISKIERARSGTAPLVLTQKGMIMGTPLYMPPEQIQAFGDVDGRADLYSVGAILFECLTGRPPHTGEGYEPILVAICTSDAPDVRAIDPAVPDGVAELVARALARDRGARFGSATEMLAAIHAVAPIERERVPLDDDEQRALAATVMMTSGPATGVTWAESSADGSAAAAGASSRRRGSTVLTATAAMLLGAIVAVVVLGWVRARQQDVAAVASAPSASAAPSVAVEPAASIAHAASLAQARDEATAKIEPPPSEPPAVERSSAARGGAKGGAGDVSTAHDANTTKRESPGRSPAAHASTAASATHAPARPKGPPPPLPPTATAGADLDLQRELP